MSKYKVGDEIIFKHWRGEEEEGEITRKIDEDSWEVYYGSGAALVSNSSIIGLQMQKPRKWWQFAKGGSVPKKADKRLLNKISEAVYEVWDEIGAESGGQIRSDAKLQAEYSKLSLKALEKLKIKKRSFTQKDFDYFENENNHLLNEFLVWNDFFTSRFSEERKKQLKNLFKLYPNSYLDPSISKVVSTQDKYIPHSKIKSLKVLIDGKEVVIKGEDVLNGAYR
jgi:hypothetical protein